jgi:NAD(P)H-hydrate epimerase
MENAGRQLADVTIEEAKACGDVDIHVLAAAGNNGGDGLVAARHLALRGVPVRVLLVSPAARYGPATDAGRNLVAVRACGVPVEEALDGEALSRFSRGGGRLLVDAVLGTGLEGPVQGRLEDVLLWLREDGSPVVAADLPSGIDADTGEALGPAPRCAATATFLAPKKGLLQGEGRRCAGRIRLCDIGVPWRLAVRPEDVPADWEGVYAEGELAG